MNSHVYNILFPTSNYFSLYNYGNTSNSTTEGNCSKSCGILSIYKAKDNIFAIGHDFAQDISTCLETCDVILESVANINITSNITWSVNHNLFIQSDHSITFSSGVGIHNKGQGTLELMTGVNNDDSPEIVNFDENYSASKVKTAITHSLQDKLHKSDKLFLPLKTTICINLFGVLQFDNKYQSMQQVSLESGSLVFVWLEQSSEKTHVMMQQTQIDGVTALSKPISIYKADTITKILAQSKENVLLVLCTSQDVQNHNFQIGWVHVDFETRQFYRDSLIKSTSSEFFLGFHDKNRFTVVTPSRQKWDRYFVDKSQSGTLKIVNTELPEIRPSEMLLYDKQKMLFCECEENIWHLKLLQDEQIQDIKEQSAPCESEIFLSKTNSEVIWAIAPNSNENMYIFRIADITQPKVIPQIIERLTEGKVISVALNSKDQIEVTQSIENYVKVYIVEGNEFRLIDTSKGQQDYIPSPIAILFNTEIPLDLLSQYKTDFCEVVTIPTEYPVQVMVASKIAHFLYPSFFPSYTFLSSDQLCVDFDHELYTSIDCPDNHNINGIEEIYAVSVLLGITLQPSSYSCLQKNGKIKIQIDFLEMAFTWFASEKLSLPVHDLEIFSDQEFAYKQRPCGTFANVVCNTERLISAYRHVIDLNQTEIDNIIDASTCIAQTYDSTSHEPYDISKDIRTMIGANKNVIANILEHYN